MGCLHDDMFQLDVLDVEFTEAQSLGGGPAMIKRCNFPTHASRMLHRVSIFVFLLFFYLSSGWGRFSARVKSTPKTLVMSALFSNLGAEDNNEEADDIIGKPVGPMPSVSSKVNFGDQRPQNIQCDLWIVGAGTLGEIVCRQYKELNPSAKIVAETLSTSRHERLAGYGAIPRLREDRSEANYQTAKNLLISLTPSSCADYSGAINDAIRLWAGPLGGGTLVFTSSLAVYGDSNGNTVTETFRLDTRSKRSTNLISAEEAVLSRDGIALRLAGLYNDMRGPHTYWLRLAKEGKVIETNADGFVNLIHYEDAASIAIAALASGLRNQVLLGVDDEMITKQEICRSALASGLFPDSPMPQFESESGPSGKRADGSLTKKRLSWSPRYPSFRRYMRALGGEVFDDSSTKAETETKKSLLWLPGDDIEGL